MGLGAQICHNTLTTHYVTYGKEKFRWLREQEVFASMDQERARARKLAPCPKPRQLRSASRETFPAKKNPSHKHHPFFALGHLHHAPAMRTFAWTFAVCGPVKTITGIYQVTF